MKARIPGYNGGNSMQAMMKQAQKMQEDMQTLQAELEEREYSASAGDGMVKATVNGKYEVLRIEIAPEVIDPDDVEMIEDLVTTALNRAISAARADSEESMGAITGGLNIPGMF